MGARRGRGRWRRRPGPAGAGRSRRAGAARAQRPPDPRTLGPSLPPSFPPSLLSSLSSCPLPLRRSLLPRTPLPGSPPVSLGNLQLKANPPQGTMYPANKKKKVWREERERLLKMTLEERRKEYLRDYVQLKDIPSWKEEMKCKGQSDDESTEEVSQLKKSLSEKVSLYRGDITLLEIDAIVNAARSWLRHLDHGATWL
uniref:Mono-ADP ribosylhydrolase 2 n=1 Tax=Ornithorhynchus anatinus TaxID=9258 RepID=A0A6I8PK31_ORNAN